MTTDPRDPASDRIPASEPAPHLDRREPLPSDGRPEPLPSDGRPASLPPHEPRPVPEPARPAAPTGTAPQEPAPQRTSSQRPSPADLEPVEETRPGRTAGAWIALIVGALLLILLLVFVLQNNVLTKFHYMGIEFGLPLGVAMLLAAVTGALVMALVGSVRMIQMSWTIRRLRKSQERIRRAAR